MTPILFILYFSLFSLILILSSLFCVDLSKTLFQTLQGEGENGSELQRQQQGTVFLLERVWGQEQKSAGSFVLCFCGIIAQLWWHTNSVFYFQEPLRQYWCFLNCASSLSYNVIFWFWYTVCRTYFLGSVSWQIYLIMQLPKMCMKRSGFCAE